MTLDVKGGLKNTEISSNQYVVIEELLSNAIDSYLIRRNSEPNTPQFTASIVVDFFPASLIDNDAYDLAVFCTDNGAGFGDEQVKAFVTRDSTYKDYLKIQGIGKCKGAGRIQYFHYFNKMKIDSAYTNGVTYKRRTLDVHADTREISESNFKSTDEINEGIKTVVTLQEIRRESLSDRLHYGNVRTEFSAHAIHSFLYSAFLQRFIVLKNIIGKFSISIAEKEGEHFEEIIIESDDLPNPIETVVIPLICSHGNQSGQVSPSLTVTRYSLPSENFKSSQHEVALCANAAIVYSLTRQYIRKQQDRKKPIDGFFELILIESDYLEDRVNVQRDGFTIPKECSQSSDINGDVSLQDIIESLEDYVYGILTPKDFDKDKLLASTQERFGISRSMLEAVNIKVHYSDTEANIAKRVLKKYQEEIVNETSDIFDIKQQLLELDPRTQDFREKVNELSWKYTSTIKKMDMANLSQLVVRRSSMLEVLKRAVSMMLSCQDDNTARRDDEKIIHNVFFPTGKDSSDSIDHDIWILNEEYHYFEHIASDKALSTLPWNENEKIFASDVDSSLEALFQKNNTEHRLKRPDIAIFNQEGAAIIIEFKAPNVELQEHIPDLVQYARLLAAKSDGKIKKFYGYLIGDCMDESRMPPVYTKFPSGSGYFNTDRIHDPATGRQYGELYSEVLFYQQFIDRAESRLDIYKKKLNIKL
ncbi:hypothetical protein [Pseudomonas sp. NPDC079086]|uniref:hypothetical protein n=1 Tax=unclassified Pseudomonas TaxID=196821 RepID=UPI0037C6B1C2